MIQKDRVLKYMHDFGSITQAEAFRDLGVYRLAARIADLKRDGVKIKTEPASGMNRYGEKVFYARYRLEKD